MVGLSKLAVRNYSVAPTLFDLPSPKALDSKDIRQLFDLVDWGIVSFHPAIHEMRGKHNAVSMYRALSLPYLINTPSERALAREIAEKPVLRVLCGFADMPPTRGMLWQFRHSPRKLYSSIMLQVLIAIAISGWRLGLRLPFVYKTELDDKDLSSAIDLSLSDFHQTHVKIWANLRTVPGVSTIGKSMTQLANELRDFLRRDDARANMSLPIEVRVTLPDTGEFYDFRIDIPPWLEPAHRFTFYGIDTLANIHSSSRDVLVACNILVLHKRNNYEEILLAKRLSGFGEGQYGLPGGKKKLNESIRDCAIRELFEETGLAVIESRPISIKVTNWPNRSPALSIGVLVNKFFGEPKRREVEHHLEWQWYPTSQLPAPLFAPTRLVLDDYMQNRFEDLTWDDLEAMYPKTFDVAEQYPLLV